MPNVCVVVPCYNEALRLPVAEFVEFHDRHQHVSLCFVNDGSPDATQSVLEGLARGREERIHVVELRPNRGKAEAVRGGMLHAAAWKAFDYVGYFDADLATPLSEVDHLLGYEPAHAPWSLILGSRVKRMGATIERSGRRHVLGRVFATAAALVLRLPVYDTQCGAKLVRADLVPALFEEPFLTRWLFDVELLARSLRLLGRETALGSILEVPVREWREKGASRLRPLDFLRAPVELWRIHVRYGVR